MLTLVFEIDFRKTDVNVNIYGLTSVFFEENRCCTYNLKYEIASPIFLALFFSSSSSLRPHNTGFCNCTLPRYSLTVEGFVLRDLTVQGFLLVVVPVVICLFVCLFSFSSSL